MERGWVLSPIHRVHTVVEEKQGECICPLSWRLHHSFVRDGRYSVVKRGERAPPTLATPKIAVATLCTLWSHELIKSIEVAAIQYYIESVKRKWVPTDYQRRQRQFNNSELT